MVMMTTTRIFDPESGTWSVVSKEEEDDDDDQDSCSSLFWRLLFHTFARCFSYPLIGTFAHRSRRTLQTMPISQSVGSLKSRYKANRGPMFAQFKSVTVSDN